MDMNNYRNKLYLISTLALGAFLRFFSLTIRPFNGDEGLIVLAASGNFINLLAKASFDVHPPLLHVLVYLSTKCFGISEWSVRLPSVLAGIGIIYFGWLLANKNFYGKIALIFAFILAICPYLVYFSQEARMYSLFGFFSLASFYYFLSAFNKPKLTNYLGFIISSILMVYTQYLGFFVLLIQLIYLLINYKKTKKIWLGWLVSFIFVFLAFLPQSFIFYKQFLARSTEQSQAIMLANNLKGLFGAIYRFGASRLFLDINPAGIKNLMQNNILQFCGFIISLILPLVLFFQGLKKIFKKYNQIFWFIILVFVFTSALAILSTEIGYRASRYLIFATPFYLLAISFGFDDFWQNKKHLLKIILIALIILWVFSLGNLYFKENRAPGADKIVQYVKMNYKNNDVVLIRGGFGGGEKWVFEYYFNDRGSATSDQRPAIVDIFGEYKIGNLAQLKKINPQDRANDLLAKYDTVWFYDLTYSNFDIYGQKHILGQDKEQKDLIVWEIKK
jgi:uncharacterized membrane protein